MLRSQYALEIGDTIVSHRKPRIRAYDTTRCWWLCSSSDGQNGHKVDTSSFNYDGWLYMKGIVGSLTDDYPLVVGTGELSIRQSWRQILLGRIEAVLYPTSVSTLGKGMLIGDRA